MISSQGTKPLKFNHEQHLQIAQDYMAGASGTQLAKKWGASVPTITKVLRRASVTRRTHSEACRENLCRIAERQRAFGPEQQKLIGEEYLGGMNTYQLAERHQVSQATIHRVIKHLNIQGRSQGPRRSIDEAAFDDAESNEAAAYYVGLLMADGSIHMCDDSRSPTIKLALAEEDAGHVHEFRDFLKSKHAISIYKKKKSFGWNAQPLHSIQVTSQRLAAALARYGVVSHKTQREKVLCLELNRHFWRGMVCGDGCLWIDKDGLPRVSLASSLELMNQYLAFCKTLFQTDARPSYSDGLWNIQFVGARGYRLVQALFENATVGLSRKMLMGERILAECARWLEATPRPLCLGLTAEVIRVAYQETGDWKKAAILLGVSNAGLHSMRKRLGMEFKPRRSPLHRAAAY